MTEVEPRRIRLLADPGSLAGFEKESVMAWAVPELRRRHSDVELRDVEQTGPDCVVVALLLPPAVRDEDIEPDLRSLLRIGPGGYQRGLETDALLGISGIKTWACECCGGIDGQHAPDCPCASE